MTATKVALRAGVSGGRCISTIQTRVRFCKLMLAFRLADHLPNAFRYPDIGVVHRNIPSGTFDFMGWASKTATASQKCQANSH